MFNYSPSTLLLKNRVILITGAGSDIGRAAAKSFAAFGATVILLGPTVSKLEAAYDEIAQAGGPQPAIYPLSLASAGPNDYENLASVLTTEFGHLDGLLHSACLLGSLTPLEHFDAQLWYQVMQVNLNAPFLLTKALLGLMKRSGDASIVFTSSDVGRKGKAYWGAYSVSQFAVEGLMQVLADELEVNTPIRVNTVNPGNVRTAIMAEAYPGKDRHSWVSMEAIMPLFVYLMGPDSREVNGQALDTFMEIA